MSDEELNKKLHEIIGLCWHEHKSNMLDPIRLSVNYGCIKCGKGFIYSYYNLLTWEGFGIMWEFMQKHPGWYDFWHHYWLTKLISPRALAEAVVEFFGEEKEGKLAEISSINSMNYEPGNCKWSNSVEQRGNRR